MPVSADLKAWYERKELRLYMDHKNHVCVLDQTEPTEIERAVRAFCESPTS